ncbi:ATP-binding protein [Caldimonas tepidiphila]|uniref:ATP-binding response regulator n=1 Tax=Caldimonas tepidiphila TaxID=2315841 RepID=UPI000E5AEF4D|nr:ATP-binding protein [Caldimonas tepidiphila]
MSMRPGSVLPPLQRPLCVLVVDDIAASRRVLCEGVARAGHRALEAASGRQALEAARSLAPDLVIMDLLMPDMDGFEATRRIKAEVPRWIPVIVVSALEGDEHFVQAIGEGADDCLSRPVSQGLLAAKLRHFARVLSLQEHLQGLARRHQAINDNVVDAVLTVDAAGVIHEANPAAARLLAGGAPLRGQPLEPLLGRPLAEAVQARELELPRADGSRFPAELRASAWQEEDGSTYTTLVLADVSERRRIERMKDEFLATVSHELRTPLTSVLGALGLIAGGAAGELPAAAQELAEVAQRNGERLGRLIDDVLDLTKLEANRLGFVLRPQPLRPLLEEALAAQQGQARQAGVTLSLQVQPQAAAARAKVDADRFAQVLANLLSNAIKHSPCGAVVELGLAADPARDALRLTVRDRGPGIPAEFRARLFERFSQADASDRRGRGGTGLGLYITRAFVERMGGRIEVESEPGRGAAFHVQLPPCEPPHARMS